VLPTIVVLVSGVLAVLEMLGAVAVKMMQGTNAVVAVVSGSATTGCTLVAAIVSGAATTEAALVGVVTEHSMI